MFRYPLPPLRTKAQPTDFTPTSISKLRPAREVLNRIPKPEISLLLVAEGDSHLPDNQQVQLVRFFLRKPPLQTIEQFSLVQKLVASL